MKRFGPRFLPLNKIYDKPMRDLFKQSAEEINFPIHEGVYGSIGGPTYESATDSRYCKDAGMDAVGMSTTHEAIVALYCGIKVVAFSIITDLVSFEYDYDVQPNHEEILRVAHQKSKQAESLVENFLKKIYENKHLID
jgi:purine-nucleoside phosphorylase